MAYVINPDLCMACGTCQGECPTGAIKEGGRRLPVRGHRSR